MDEVMVPRGTVEWAIANVCDQIKTMLLGKNRSYGNSVFEPMRVFSKAGTREQILVRIDDKLTRIQRGSLAQMESGEDTIRDLIGYLVILVTFDALDGSIPDDDGDGDEDCSINDEDEIPAVVEDDPGESAQDLADDLLSVFTLCQSEVDVDKIPEPRTGLGKDARSAVLFVLERWRHAEHRVDELTREKQASMGKGPVAVEALREIVRECDRRIGRPYRGAMSLGRLGPAEATWHPIVRGIRNVAERGLGDDPIFMARAKAEIEPNDDIKVASGAALDAIAEQYGLKRENRADEDGAVEPDAHLRERIVLHLRNGAHPNPHRDMSVGERFALDAARMAARTAIEERDELRCKLKEIDELVGPGGDNTTFGRVESLLDDHEQERVKARARIRELEARLENALDASKEGAWQARALDAERERDAAREHAQKLHGELVYANDMHDAWMRELNAVLNPGTKAMSTPSALLAQVRAAMRLGGKLVDYESRELAMRWAEQMMVDGHLDARQVDDLKGLLGGSVRLAPVPESMQKITEAAIRQGKALMRHRERYLKAWCAAYGVEDPREVVMIEEMNPAGGFCVWFKKAGGAK